MANQPTNSPAPVTEEAFMADRTRFWEGFVSATTWVTGGIILLLVLLKVFVG